MEVTSYYDKDRKAYVSGTRYGALDGKGLWDESMPADESGTEQEARMAAKAANPKKDKAAKKVPIGAQVTAATETLKAMNSHLELRKWAQDNGMNSAAGFSAFKKALLAIGIDYDEIRAGIQAQEAAQTEAAITHTLTLFVDAKASAGKFAICDKDGQPVWFGKFFDNEDAGEQSRAELCAAEKAVWLASKVKEALKVPAIHLFLNVDADWLTYQDHAGQKGYVLTQKSRRYNIKLEVNWIPGKKNPADQYTTGREYKKWNDNDLTALCTPYMVKAE